MKKLALGLFVLALVVGVQAQQQQGQEEMVTVTIPKSSLTPQQQQTVKQQEIHNWVGIGKEVGEAVNSSLQAITTQSNNFAQTGVGRLTVAIVIWKVIGDQVVHIFGGIVELLIFLPIWIWSYRRMCLTRRFKTGKDTWQVVEYRDTSGPDAPSPRTTHVLIAIGIVAIVLVTIFTY